MTAQEIVAYVETLAPPKGGEEIFRWGNPATEVTGLLVAWMATVEAIEYAAANGCNFIISHESLHFPYSHINPGLENYATWTTNRLRLTALSKHDITLYQCHTTADRFSIFGDAVSLLGLGKWDPAQGYTQVFDIEPVSLRELVGRVKAAMGMDTLRVSGDLDAMVSRVGCPWGGVGLSLNVSFIEAVIAKGANGLIAGESDEYAMRYAADAGVPMIETSHAGSENPGLRRFADHLRDHFGRLKVLFYEVPPAWTCL